MSKLIRAEWKRYLSSPCYLGALLILIVLYSTDTGGWIPILSNLFFWGDQFMYNNSILAVLLSLLIFTYIYESFFTGNICVKLILGYTKRQIFVSETIVCGFASGLLVVVGNVIYIINRLCHKEALELPADAMIMNTIIFMSSIACIAIIISSLSFVLKKNIFTPLILACMTVLMLQLGTKDISLLTFSESTLAIQEENETDEGRYFIANSLRVSDKVRGWLNFRIMISPYAQCNYSAYLTTERKEDKPNLSFFFQENPYHIDFLLSNVVEAVFVIFAGSNLFKRQNI